MYPNGFKLSIIGWTFSNSKERSRKRSFCLEFHQKLFKGFLQKYYFIFSFLESGDENLERATRIALPGCLEKNFLDNEGLTRWK